MKSNRKLAAGVLALVSLALIISVLVGKDAWTSEVGLTDSPPANQSYFSLQDIRDIYAGKAEPLAERYQAIYNATVMELLTQTLWTARDIYDTGHYLMIPMYQAFWSENQEAIQAFHRFFERFSTDMIRGGVERQEFDSLGALNQAHILYLTTQYANLCAAYGYIDRIPWELLSIANDCAVNALYQQKSNWGVEKNEITRIRKVLKGKHYSRHYYGSIHDLVTFPLAILCDLCALYRMCELTPTSQMDEAVDFAYQIFSSPLLNEETPGNGWIFQPGAWSDHSDYAYAGQETIYDGMEKKILEDVAEDSSHFHRVPVFLRSYQAAQTLPERQELFKERRKQLANQMANVVLKNVGGYWLTTTFMDGINGVYRYSYHEEGIGYEGYELSGTFLLGWWSLLQDNRITQCYWEILEKFPMPEEERNPYFNSVTVREQNPFFDMDTAYDNGMFECMVACAANVSAAQEA